MLPSASTSSSATRTPLSALRHPLWWIALAVLVLNDHVLKGAGLLPGAVTGKLSDFAGMLVAPVLLAAICRAQSRRAIAACFVAPGVVFAAIKASPVAAHAAEALMAFVPWRVWSDPTDLFALPMLLVGWHFFVEPVRADANAGARGNEPSLLTRSAMALGAIACIATSAPNDPPPPFDPRLAPPRWGTLEVLLDDTTATPTRGEIVRVRRLRSEVRIDCAALLAAPLDVVTSPLLGTAERYSLINNSVLDVSGSTPRGPGGATCDFAVLDHDSAGSITVAYAREGGGSRAVLTRAVDGTFRWADVMGEAIVVRSVPGLPPTSDACGARGATLPVTWSAIDGSYFAWHGASNGADGCTVVKLGYNLAGLPDASWYVCGVDETALPFEYDETVQITADAFSFTIRAVDGRARVSFGRVPDPAMRFERARDCIVTDACGERSVPLDPRMPESEWALIPSTYGALAVFERGAFGAERPEQIHVLRAVHWLAADTACVDGGAIEGDQVELLRVSVTPAPVEG